MSIRSCKGRVLKPAVLALWLADSFASAQTAQKPAPKKVSAHLANELTLAGLHPGRDTAARALFLYKKPSNKSERQATQLVWGATCEAQTRSVDLEANKKIQVIRTIETQWAPGDCRSLSAGRWKMGRGLGVGDAAARVVELYGEPDSRNPSTKDGQPLELMYYALDWAGPDVPQLRKCSAPKTRTASPAG